MGPGPIPWAAVPVGQLEEGRFDGAPPDLVHEPTGFRIWFTAPLGIVTQVGEATQVGDDLATFLATRGQEGLDRRRRGDERFLYLHDWRRLDKYTGSARKIMTDWAMDVRDRSERIVIALRPEAKIVRMGVSVATMALQVAGFRVEVVDNLNPVLRQLRIRHAPS